MATASVIESAEATNDFTELVEKHRAMIFSVAYHFLHDKAAAEEVAQDVFLQLHFHLNELGSAEQIVFWLRRVAANRCIDEARRRKRRGEVALDAADAPASRSGGDELWVSERLRRLVASLPEKQRMMIILRYQEDLDPMEIAKLLDMSVNTVKSQLQRALILLREKSGVERRT